MMRFRGALVAMVLLGACFGAGDTLPPEPAAEASAATEAAASADAGAAESETGATASGAEPQQEDAPAEAPAETEPDAPARSPQQIACERDGGRYVPASPGSALRVCLKLTRDAARQCDAPSDCEGACLARSRTCAPVVPLMGCNEVLLEGGSTAVECVQ